MAQPRLFTTQLQTKVDAENPNIGLIDYCLMQGYLSIKELLLLRSLNRFSKETEKKRAQRGPYQSQTQFLIATSPTYRCYQLLLSAWNVYNDTLQSVSSKPVMIYKLRDFFAAQSTAECWNFDWWEAFKDGDNLIDEGRRYNPKFGHTWDVNSAWCLAQIHKGRKLVILSGLSEKNHKRRYQAGQYSAFSKEIAMFFKTGYKIESFKRIKFYGSIPFYQVTLTPAFNLNEISQLPLHYFNPTPADCFQAVEILNQIKIEFLKEQKMEDEKQYVTELSSFSDLPESVESETVEKNLKIALDKYLTSQVEIDWLKHKNLTVRLTFNNEYGLKGLEESLFTLTELDPLPTYTTSRLLTKEGLELLRKGFIHIWEIRTSAGFKLLVDRIADFKKLQVESSTQTQVEPAPKASNMPSLPVVESREEKIVEVPVEDSMKKLTLNKLNIIIENYNTYKDNFRLRWFYSSKESCETICLLTKLIDSKQYERAFQVANQYIQDYPNKALSRAILKALYPKQETNDFFFVSKYSMGLQV